MKSNEKSRYCLDQFLIPMFKRVFIDAVQGNILNPVGYFAIISYLMLSIIATINGIYLMGAESSMTLLGACYLVGVVQVITQRSGYRKLKRNIHYT